MNDDGFELHEWPPGSLITGGGSFGDYSVFGHDFLHPLLTIATERSIYRDLQVSKPTKGSREKQQTFYERIEEEENISLQIFFIKLIKFR